MSRPDSIKKYPDVDLKLGIKSSLPSIKATLGLLVMIWRVSDAPAEILYARSVGDSIEVTDELSSSLQKKYRSLYTNVGMSDNTFIERINGNQLFKSQLESLIVAFELIWRVAKVKFEGNRPASLERTGGIRYPKILQFTKNMDIIDSLVSSNDDEYSKVLLSWVGFEVTPQASYEYSLLFLLNNLAEEAVFKLADNERDIIFNLNSIYEKLLESGESVDISDTREPKGPLRILKSSFSDKMYPFLTYIHPDIITIANDKKERLAAYKSRVNAYLSLTNAKHVISTEPLDVAVAGPETVVPNISVSDKQQAFRGVNVLLYGVPGSGKSHTIKEQYCNDETRMERIVFHPDFTYADFVGQIMPIVSEGIVSYEFSVGPFTRLLKKAFENGSIEYFLVIEEINRGNAPAIFGDIFQLLDRDQNGISEYGISNADIAREVYGDENIKVRIPSNMTIIGTMNTSDQNVFTLDTAFQRRWSMRMIENNVDKVSFADVKILDTDVTWRRFNSVINSIILQKNVHAASSEDKRLGAYFVQESDLYFNPNGATSTAPPDEQRRAFLQNNRFPEKILKYLWDDAFRFSKEDIFDSSLYASLEDVVKKFRESSGNERFTVFRESIYTSLIS